MCLSKPENTEIIWLLKVFNLLSFDIAERKEKFVSILIFTESHLLTIYPNP